MKTLRMATRDDGKREPHSCEAFQFLGEPIGYGATAEEAKANLRIAIEKIRVCAEVWLEIADRLG